MFTEDYLMRMINQALAALLTAIGLKKAGKFEAARQAIDQAVEGLTSMPAGLVDQLDEDGLLSLLATQDRFHAGRLAVLADLVHEQAGIQEHAGQAAQAAASRARALRLLLEAILAGEGPLFPELILKAEARRRSLAQADLPVQTRLALLEYFQHLRMQDEALLEQAGLRSDQVSADLGRLEAELAPFLKTNQG